MNDNSYAPLLPLLVLGAGTVLALLFGLGRKKPELARQRALVVAIGALVVAAAAGARTWPSESGAALGFLTFDSLTTFFLAFVILVVLIGLILGRLSSEIEPGQYGEWAAVLLALGFGLTMMAGASDLLMAYLAIETVSICSYVLTAFRRKSHRSHEAALKYAIYGGVASGVMLFGMSLLFGLAGGTSFEAVAAALSPTGPLAAAGKAVWFGVFVLVLLTLAGFGYKIASVPFHMWCPDVYEGAPTPFTAFLSVGPKAAGFALLIRFMSTLFGGEDSEVPWQALVGVLAVATMTLGNLSAIPQTNVKRLLAFSSIAHAGYMLMGVSALGAEASSAIMLYLVVYLVMNLGAFAVVQAVQDATGSADLKSFRGLGSRSPFAAVALSVFLFSLTGLPPLAGFIGKFYLFAAVIHMGGFWYILLAVIGLLNGAISLYYYARVVKMMYFEKAETTEPLPLCPGLQTVFGVLLVPTIAFGIYWEPLRTMSNYAVAQLPLA